jgi:hypothetical protein
VRACVSNESYTISAEVDRGFHGETADETRILTGLHRNVPLGRPADDQVMTLCRSPSASPSVFRDYELVRRVRRAEPGRLDVLEPERAHVSVDMVLVEVLVALG